MRSKSSRPAVLVGFFFHLSSNSFFALSRNSLTLSAASTLLFAVAALLPILAAALVPEPARALRSSRSSRRLRLRFRFSSPAAEPVKAPPASGLFRIFARILPAVTPLPPSYVSSLFLDDVPATRQISRFRDTQDSPLERGSPMLALRKHTTGPRGHSHSRENGAHARTRRKIHGLQNIRSVRLSSIHSNLSWSFNRTSESDTERFRAEKMGQH